MDFVNKRILGSKIVILFDKFKDIGYFWQNRTNWSDKLAFRFSELELENIFYFEIDSDTLKTMSGLQKFLALPYVITINVPIDLREFVIDTAKKIIFVFRETIKFPRNPGLKNP